MKWGRLCCLCLLIGCLLACHSGSNHSEETGEENDLPQIIDRGELVVLTVNGSTSYFNYRGEPMGFQYELAQQFAASLGVKLKLKVVKNTEELVRQLLNGEGDLIAYNLPVTNALKDSVIYCGEANITHQVVVQRKGKDALKNVTQLVGKEVYVQPGKYQERLINLDKELGGGIQIHTIAADSISAEELISWVAEGKIDYTVSTDELAKINRTYYPNLNIGWPSVSTSVLHGLSGSLHPCWHRLRTNGTRRISTRRNLRPAPNDTLNLTSMFRMARFCL